MQTVKVGLTQNQLKDLLVILNEEIAEMQAWLGNAPGNQALTKRITELEALESKLGETLEKLAA